MLAFALIVPLRCDGAESASPALCMRAGSGPTRSAAVAVGGVKRTYLVHAPPAIGRERLPIVFAFAGRGETPELLERYSRLSGLHAIVVYPRGLPGSGGKLSWSGTPTAAPGADDIAFVRAIFGRLRGLTCVDASRVFVTGKSDGGGLAARLACTAADLIRAAASVAGAYYPIAGGCRPIRPVGIREFHGTGDRVVPYAGSARRRLPDIAGWLAAWARRDGCRSEPVSDAPAPGIVKRSWSPCRDGVTVAGYRIAGGGHTWPGASSPSGPGTTTQAIDATALIAAFFGIAFTHDRP